MASGQDIITINIIGPGANAKFVQEGKTAQEPVEVIVGQSVKWVNKSDMQHSARSLRKLPDDTRIFDTRILTKSGPKQSSTVLFDLALFQTAGGVPGGSVTLEYECQVHPSMMSSIVLKSNEQPAPPSPMPPTPAPPAPTPSPIPPTPPGQAKLHVFEAVTDGPNQLFTPKTVDGVEVGDEFIWRNIADRDPGLHAVRFPNWNNDRECFEILGSDVPFDVEEGQTQENSESDSRGTIFLRAKLVRIPSDKHKIDFYCPVHGITMNGSINFAACEPESNSAGLPEYVVSSGLIAAFDAVKVTDKKSDSYFALSSDFNGDGKVDLVTSGLGEPGKSFAEVAWFENPSWRKHLIGMFDVPVALDAADVDQDGRVDLAICYDYGTCIFGCTPDNGTIAWLRNPGFVEPCQPWERFQIGKLMATHRLAFGNFTQTDTLQLMAVPVVGGPDGKIHDPISILVFSKPDDPATVTEWPSEEADNSLRVIHEIAVLPMETVKGVALDSVLTASEEGISWLRFNGEKWALSNLGTGELGQINVTANNWKGSGAVDIGRYGPDPCAYIVATEPFHGNLLSVYMKDVSGGLENITWSRQSLDVFGPLNNRGEGPGHDITMADLDGDGTDECLVGLRGPMPYCGVQIYKVQDLVASKFIRQQASPVSTAQVIVDDFDNDGVPDFVTIPYRVLTYYEADDTEVMLYLNRTPQKKAKSDR